MSTVVTYYAGVRQEDNDTNQQANLYYRILTHDGNGSSSEDGAPGGQSTEQAVAGRGDSD